MTTSSTATHAAVPEQGTRFAEDRPYYGGDLEPLEELSPATRQPFVEHTLSLPGTEFNGDIEKDSAVSGTLPRLRVVRPVVLPPKTNRRGHFRSLQAWEGLVVDVWRDSGQFSAELRDLTSPEAPRETTTFDFDEISPSDWELIEPGAAFYWSIGYFTEHDGRRRRVSEIRFRRLSIELTSEELRAAHDTAMSTITRFE